MENPFDALVIEGNTLCLGHWEITYQGKPITLPEERNANTIWAHAEFTILSIRKMSFISKDWMKMTGF